MKYSEKIIAGWNIFDYCKRIGDTRAIAINLHLFNYQMDYELVKDVYYSTYNLCFESCWIGEWVFFGINSDAKWWWNNISNCF